MIDILKLILIFAAIVVGLRYKIFVGTILLSAGIMTALVYQLDFGTATDGYLNILKSRNFHFLYGIIIQITFLGRILKEIGYLDRLKNSTDNLKGGARTASALLPAMIGLMPMPGGALLSAPLVGKVLDDQKYSAELKSAVNYWSRHVIEFCWPVYPGVILAATMTDLPIGTVALLNMPMTFIMLPIGIYFLIRKIDKSNKKGELFKPLLRLFYNIWPILLAVAIYGVFGIPLIFCISITLIVLLIKERPAKRLITDALKASLHPRLLVLVFGVLSFQHILELTNAVSSMTRLSTELGFPSEIIIIVVSFISGLLTGILFALIALAYPLLTGFFHDPDPNLANIFLAFVSGYVGMIFSPTHFCLILTNEHFKANLFRVYKLLTVPLMLLFAAGYLLFKLGYPWNLFE